MENSSSTILELAIRLQSTDGHEQLIETSSLFSMIVFVSNSDTIPVTNPDMIGPVPTILLNENDDPQVVREILENKPDWIQALVLPLILLVSGLYIVWRYWPKGSQV